MARANERGGWDFVKVGKVYQYKEDYMICDVEILEDNSTDEAYSFVVRAIRGILPPEEMEHNLQEDGTYAWLVYHTKNLTGMYSGMIQLYENDEYGGYARYDYPQPEEE